jgi:putative mRNA 3-end processing factor
MALQLGEHKVALDSTDDNADVNFVSHAHTDHTSGLRKNRKAIASEITKELIESRSNIKVELIEEPDSIKLLNAGHILGSKQLYVQNDLYGYSLLYSGDYQTSEPIAAEKIEITQADVLIVDSTYPYPHVKFEDREEVITAIQHYTRMKVERGNVVFGAHVIGRAQELIKIMNEVGITPVVSEKISAANKVYEKHGFGMQYLDYNSAEISAKENFAMIVEQSKIDGIREMISAKSSKRVFTAVASGFAKMFNFGTDVQFALSDHVDFSQALEYMNACSPKVVFTCGPNAKTFAKNLILCGYDARPVYRASDVDALMVNYI